MSHSAEYPDCIGELEIQLAIIFCAKRMFEQLRDIVSPRLSYARGQCRIRQNNRRAAPRYWETQLEIKCCPSSVPSSLRF